MLCAYNVLSMSLSTLFTMVTVVTRAGCEAVGLVSKHSILPTPYTKLTGSTLTYPSSFYHLFQLFVPTMHPTQPWLYGFSPRTREEILWEEGGPLVLYPIAHTVVGTEWKISRPLQSITLSHSSLSCCVSHIWPIPCLPRPISVCLKPLSPFPEGTAFQPFCLSTILWSRRMYRVNLWIR